MRGGQNENCCILHITSANSTKTIPSLQLAPEVINEIQAAVAVGKEVIAHHSNITAFGWTGAGYAIFDPVTGDGAWRISGGGNGGIALIQGASIGLMFLSLIMSAGTTAIAVLPLIVASIFYFMSWRLLSVSSDDKGRIDSCFIRGFLYSMSAALIFLGAFIMIHGAVWVAATQAMTIVGMQSAALVGGLGNLVAATVGGVPSLSECGSK
ncbi:MAG: hypothetical protein R8L53_03190 [Mariprofundales bacterium]